MLRKVGDGEAAQRAYAAAAERLENLPASETTAGTWGYLAQAYYETQQYDKAHQALDRDFQLRVAEAGPTVNMGPRWWYLAMSCR